MIAKSFNEYVYQACNNFSTFFSRSICLSLILYWSISQAKLAKLRRDLLAPPTKGGDAAAGEGFDVTKSGDSRVGLVGFPSLGKSTLLNKLTGTFSEVSTSSLEAFPSLFVFLSMLELLHVTGIYLLSS